MARQAEVGSTSVSRFLRDPSVLSVKKKINGKVITLLNIQWEIIVFRQTVERERIGWIIVWSNTRIGIIEILYKSIGQTVILLKLNNF